ncbi:glutamate ABC transporter substrate-binding protein [Streptomyces sp. NPDC048442]|uniref:glutamate ABC transporter substrate-binding protein n=1 Tax=Streptomyces sp. NPDC048442 TaxID=3154823 RepID=UPI003436E43E
MSARDAREARDQVAGGSAMERTGSAGARAAGTGRARTLRGGWRLGLVALASACVLTAGVAVLPLPDAAGSGSDTVSSPGSGTVAVLPAKAAECENPEASLRPSPLDGPAIKRIKSRTGDTAGKLVAGIDQNSYRWGYRNPASGQLEGFDIDIVKAIATELFGSPDKVIYRAIPTSQRIPALQDNKVDIVVRTMTVNCARIKDVAFSHAYFQAGQQVLAPKESQITGYDDSLKGKRVCTAAGSTAFDAMKKESHGALFDDPRYIVPNQLDCLVRLQLGEADAIVTDNALAASQAAQDPAIEVKGTPFTTEYYGVATNKEDVDLVRRINKVLAEYSKARWAQSYEDWLKAGLGKSSGPPAPKFKD